MVKTKSNSTSFFLDKQAAYKASIKFAFNNNVILGKK